MHGQVFDPVDHARYLGVDISSDLNFNHHINRVTPNASKSLGFLKRNIKTKIPVYKKRPINLQSDHRSNTRHLFGVCTLRKAFVK